MAGSYAQVASLNGIVGIATFPPRYRFREFEACLNPGLVRVLEDDQEIASISSRFVDSIDRVSDMHSSATAVALQTRFMVDYCPVFEIMQYRQRLGDVSFNEHQPPCRVRMMEEQQIVAAQDAWGEGIVKIGKTFLDKGDYRAAAEEHINNYYNYQEGSVLFKPTLASERQFRTDFEGALSYFVGGNNEYPEDGGFAIKPWSDVRWDRVGAKIIGNMGVAMGNYHFTPADGSDVVKVEYSFAYTVNSDGVLKIILHDSHLPYDPKR